MPALRYRITTLGCRVNHAEAREIESVLIDRGLERARSGEPADLEIIHTCSVTGTAAAKSRQAVRRARRRQIGSSFDRSHQAASLHTPEDHCPPGPNSGRGPEVVVTGCFVGTNPHEAADLAGSSERVLAHHFVHEIADEMAHETVGGAAPRPGAGGFLIERLASHVDRWLTAGSGCPASNADGPDRAEHADIRKDGGASSSGPATPGVIPLPMVMPTRSAGAHVRAELRIQEGCDAHCSFCIIPSIRRTLRSKSVADAIVEARRLVDLGHREIVLTGIFIGAYGHETALRRRQARRGAPWLADLIDAVASVPGLARLRVSSMEPGDVTGPVLDAMVAGAPTVVPHLHLPLQSGADRILRAMNRQYGVGEYLDMIDQVNAALTVSDDAGVLPPALTTDIICGFPGETDAEFEQTVAIARRVGFLHMHVFPFSPRAGTAAARWTDRFVADREKRRRVRRLIDLEDDPGGGLSIRARRRLLGRRVRVILEQPDEDRPGFMTGRCDHYTRVTVRTKRTRGQVVEARVTDVEAARALVEADEFAPERTPAGDLVRLPVLA